jgi:hypothetical protein
MLHNFILIFDEFDGIKEAIRTIPTSINCIGQLNELIPTNVDLFIMEIYSSWRKHATK